jgi:hypothetical protein
MLIKEEVFVIAEDYIKPIPYFSGDDALNNCLRYLKKKHIIEPDIYLGLWFEEPNDNSTIQKNWEIDLKTLKKITKLKGHLCVSIY